MGHRHSPVPVDICGDFCQLGVCLRHQGRHAALFRVLGGGHARLVALRVGLCPGPADLGASVRGVWAQVHRCSLIHGVYGVQRRSGVRAQYHGLTSSSLLCERVWFVVDDEYWGHHCRHVQQGGARIGNGIVCYGSLSRACTW